MPVLSGAYFRKEYFLMNLKSSSFRSAVHESDVTLPALKQILEAAHYDCEIGPNGILCVEGIDVPRPIWITINPEQRIITLAVYDCPPFYTDGKDLARMLNTLNAKVGFVTFYMANGYLHGEYSFTYSHALDVKHFVENFRRFSRTYDTAIANGAELRARD
jgi:hypothetical protein